VAWAIGLVLVIAFGLLLLVDTAVRPFAGLALLGLFFLGLILVLAASLETGDRAKSWSELGRSLLVAGLLAFAVWFVGELRRPAEERNALRVTLGLQREMPGIDLHGKDLSGFNFAGKNLEGADLEGAKLSKATLVGANLSGANLADADLSDGNLEEAVLDGADLSQADLQNVEATLSDFREARLPGADLSGAELSGADMEGVCLADGSLVDANLPDAHLEDAALTYADLEDARFWFDLRPAYLKDVGLDGARHASQARWPPAFAAHVKELTSPGDGGSPSVVIAPPSSCAVPGWCARRRKSGSRRRR